MSTIVANLTRIEGAKADLKQILVNEFAYAGDGKIEAYAPLFQTGIDGLKSQIGSASTDLASAKSGLALAASKNAVLDEAIQGWGTTYDFTVGSSTSESLTIGDDTYAKYDWANAITAIAGKLEAFSDSVADLTSQVNTLTGEKATLEAEKAQLTSDLATANSTISSMEADEADWLARLQAI